MASKKGGMDLGTLLIYGVGAYFVYTNWSSISAWFSNLTTPAAAVPASAVSPTLAPSSMSVTPISPGMVVATAPAPASSPAPAVAPASAGTLVPLAPTQSTPPPVTSMPPTGSQSGPGLTVQTGEGPIVWGQPAAPVFEPAPIVIRGPLIPPASLPVTRSIMPHYRVY